MGLPVALDRRIETHAIHETGDLLVSFTQTSLATVMCRWIDDRPSNDLPQRKFPILVLIFSLNERLVSCHVPILMSSE